MANPEPIRQYLAAVEALKAGEKDKAAEHLTLAIGGEAPSPALKHSVEKMLTPGTYINELIIQLVASTVTRKEYSYDSRRGTSMSTIHHGGVDTPGGPEEG